MNIKDKNSTKDITARVQRVTVWGLIVNLVLSGLKFLAGIFGNSQALIADAVHSLSDSVTDVAVLIGAPRWSAPADDHHPYGHGRIETIITFMIGVVLAGVGIGLVFNALNTLDGHESEAPGWIAFVVACISMVSKEILYRYNITVGRKVKSTALLANAWHHRSDGLSSLPVALVVLGTRIQPEWTFLDHIGAMIVSVFILQAAWKIIWPALNQLSDAGATEEEREKLYTLVMRIAEVKDVHKIRTRNIGSGLQVDLHVKVDDNLTVREGHDISHIVKDCLLNDGPDVVDVLVHIEPSSYEQ